MTPEGKVKKKVDALLDKYKCYYRKPVTGGYGKAALDYEGCSRGRFFAVETKPAGEKPTDRQLFIAETIREAGGRAFVVIGDDGLAELEQWLATSE